MHTPAVQQEIMARGRYPEGFTALVTVVTSQKMHCDVDHCTCKCNVLACCLYPIGTVRTDRYGFAIARSHDGHHPSLS